MSNHEDNVKGAATISTRDWLDERLGAGWFTKTVRELEPKWPERLLQGDWYGLRPQTHALRKALPQISGHDSVESVMVTIAGLTAEKDLTGVHRAFLWVANPRMFLMATPRLWATYCQFGKTEVIENQPSQFVAHLQGVPEDLVDWAAGSFRGFLPPALLLAGAKDPVGTVQDRRRSRSANTWEFTYQLRYG